MSEQFGDVVKGTVVRIRTYGAFVELPSGETGLVHISEIAEEFVRSVADFLTEGEQVAVKILGRNEEDKLNLSIKQVNPQDEASMRYEQEMVEVQRDLSERELHLPRVKINRIEEPDQNPFLTWVEDARKTLYQLERKRMKHKQSGQRHRPRNRRPSRRRSR